jgi:hypothetical protein
LYGITGNGANDPEVLYEFINKTPAGKTLRKSLVSGTDGEAIGFNPNDGLLYHASGNELSSPGSQIFESINLANFPAAPLEKTLSGDSYEEALGLTYRGGNSFLLTSGFVAHGTSQLLTLTTTGVAASLGSMDHDAKGLAFAPKPPADFDRDIKNDIGIYRNGAWSIRRSSDGGVTIFGWGASGWIPVAADYDGDGKVDIAVYNPIGVWSIVRSTDGGNTIVGWGGDAQDMVVPADYDGDGKADVAIYRNGVWSIVRSTDGGNTLVGWGGSTWIPVVADYDGDGEADIAVYNPIGVWSIIRSSDGGNTVVGWGGGSQDIAVPADYDGDGKADIAIYRNGVWTIKRSSDGGNTIVALGGGSQVPVPADYDGDGKADIAVYNPIGVWTIKRSSDGGNTVVGWGGGAQDIPLN